jgi:hypothetical protein
LAPFLIKAETFNNIVGDEDEVPAVQDIQVPSQHQNFSMNGKNYKNGNLKF